MIAEAIGFVVTVGTALATMTETLVVKVLKLVVSVGVKVTPWLAVPAFGEVVRFVKAKVPDMLARPLPSKAEARVWP